ncbi:hypothetical protein [Alicyclobacillus kakegawensis]|uniref:hypothetical protein n=1 Tax=Alicyclobacillus kakegawensis TaxID=392012 RepID=UPI000ACC7364|nr:hypothetical protein [Alicyclobacillus kakegawensis]
MNFIKQYSMTLIGLLIALIVLMVLLRLLSKAPVIGKVAAEAQNLAKEGTL